FDGLSLTNAQLVFVPTQNANNNSVNPSSFFTFQVKDGGGTGSGGADTDPLAKTITLSLLPVNDAPTGTDKTATIFSIASQNVYTFTLADFGYADTADNPSPDNLKFVNITSIAGINAADQFTDNNVAVTLNQQISLADIQAGLLKLTTP